MSDTETTPKVEHLTYAGSYRKARVHLPERHVEVERGKRYAFTTDEIAHLDPTIWAELAPKPERTVEEILAGNVAQVLKDLDDYADRAADLLAAEQAGANRKGVVKALEAVLADDAERTTTETEADQAANQGS